MFLLTLIPRPLVTIFHCPTEVADKLPEQEESSKSAIWRHFLHGLKRVEAISEQEVADKHMSLVQGWINPGDVSWMSNLSTMLLLVAGGWIPVEFRRKT